MVAPVSIEIIATGIILVAFALIVYFVLKQAGGRKKVPPPPTPPGPYENDKDNAGGKDKPHDLN
jgi:hypothetical protein